MKFNVLESWLSTVSYSQIKKTEGLYRRSLQKFLDFTGKTPQGIAEEYDASTDQVFRRKYAQHTEAFILEMQKRGYSPKTISVTANIVKSFFKYNDLPLGFIPSGSHLIVFHNRDINKKEIGEIFKLANVRD